MAKLSIKRLGAMFRRLATSTSAGIDARTMWQREIDFAPSSARSGLQSLTSMILSGDAVAKAMKQSGLFPQLAYEMVDVGEKSGRVDTVFEQLSEHYANLAELRRTFLMGILWPMIQFFAAIVIFGLLILVLGWVASFNNSEPIDILGLGLGTQGSFILYCFAVIVMLGGAALLIQGTFRGWFGQLPMRIALRIPLIGSTIQNLALSRMAWSLSMAHNAGMDAIETTVLGIRATQIDYYTRHCQAVSDSIRAGNEMNYALQRTQAFPAELIETLSTGEVTGQVSEALDRLSREYRDRAQVQFQTISVIGGFLVLLMVAAIIGFLVIYLAMVFYIGPLNELSKGNI
jgi:type II secretory pathway component PulF